MSLKRVAADVYLVAMGQANAYLIDAPGELTLIDAGFPDKEAAVFAAMRELGHAADKLRHLILTHGHRDHIGSAAAIVRATGARTYLHPADIGLVEAGGPYRPMRPAPGLLRKVMCRLMFDPNQKTAPVKIDRPLADGETLPIAGGLEVIPIPGHCAGQVALLSRARRTLFAADAFMNIFGVADPIGFEDLALGRASQRRLAGLAFESVGFGHGGFIERDGPAKLKSYVSSAA